MRTTYLKEFNDHVKKGIAFIPLGTLEWHGKHLPIETDLMVGQKICEILAQKLNGYVVPPIYLATDGATKKGKGKLIGMDHYLKKTLPGSLYYVKPALLFSLVVSLGDSLMRQGFKKIYVISGHSGTRQILTLRRAAKTSNKIVYLDPYDMMSIVARHADEYETSLLWACYPQEIAKSKKVKLSPKDDIVKFFGYDPRKKASLKLGQKLLREVVKNIFSKIV